MKTDVCIDQSCILTQVVPLLPALAAISLSFGLSAGLVMLTWEASISKEYKFNIWYQGNQEHT